MKVSWSRQREFGHICIGGDVSWFDVVLSKELMVEWRGVVRIEKGVFESEPFVAFKDGPDEMMKWGCKGVWFCCLRVRQDGFYVGCESFNNRNSSQFFLFVFMVCMCRSLINIYHRCVFLRGRETRKSWLCFFCKEYRH